MILTEEKKDQTLLSVPFEPSCPTPSYSTHTTGVSSDGASSYRSRSPSVSGPSVAPYPALQTFSPASAYPRPLNPSSSLSRLPSDTIRPAAFKPIFVYAEGNSLRRGFPHLQPPTRDPELPHPFLMHDVLEHDWLQFVDELRETARLTDKEHLTANSVPVLSGIPFINWAVANAVTRHQKGKKPRLVGMLVDKWNHVGSNVELRVDQPALITSSQQHFFHPRRLQVILMRGASKMSGQSDQPIAGLYTPESSNFNPPVLEGNPSAEKIYRLFVVSLEA
ncbi:unnamed protein product [Mycena citricolor]|uniref:Uncharacterized protein n=1 Tax=Mycena citricolor TaxID=2018698 RepID=A0AAD2K1M7_9AGAR|nr:unnamed protein product [Mycena citricolor]